MFVSNSISINEYNKKKINTKISKLFKHHKFQPLIFDKNELDLDELNSFKKRLWNFNYKENFDYFEDNDKIELLTTEIINIFNKQY